MRSGFCFGGTRHSPGPCKNELTFKMPAHATDAMYRPCEKGRSIRSIGRSFRAVERSVGALGEPSSTPNPFRSLPASDAVLLRGGWWPSPQMPTTNHLRRSTASPRKHALPALSLGTRANTDRRPRRGRRVSACGTKAGQDVIRHVVVLRSLHLTFWRGGGLPPPPFGTAQMPRGLVASYSRSNTEGTDRNRRNDCAFDYEMTSSTSR